MIAIKWCELKGKHKERISYICESIHISTIYNMDFILLHLQHVVLMQNKQIQQKKRLVCIFYKTGMKTDK